MDNSIDIHKIQFNSYAKNWNEALPVGNSRLGGMIFGNVHTERIQLNEDSIWYGGFRDRNNPSAHENLEKIRKLIFDGKINEAQELCTYALSGLPEEQSHYEPMGNLFIEFESDSYEYTDYKRELDLKESKAVTEYSINGVKFKREVIASYPAKCMIIRLSSDQKGSLSFQTHLGRGFAPWEDVPYKEQIVRRQNYNKFADEVKLDENHFQIMNASVGGSNPIKFSCALFTKVKGGETEYIGNTVIVRNADEAVLFLSAETSFRFDDYEKKAAEDIQRISDKTWEELEEEHLKDYGSLYNRVKLEIDDDKETVRFFNFGRYLLISSSRPGSLPANLQGIWNEDYSPAWGSRFTININTQMNYWPANITGLSECEEPLFDLLERMWENGKKTAEKMYGCKGFAAHHNTDIWGDTAPQDVCLSSTYWVLGGAWLSLHIWDHYLFNRDKKFLAKYYPIMRDAAVFVMDYLCEDGDKLVLCPTLSPENTYINEKGEKGFLCKGATMDNEIIRELLEDCVKAETILFPKEKLPKKCKGKETVLKEDIKATLKMQGVEETERISDRALKTLKKIPPIKIAPNGTIMEWNENYEEAEPGHRHISHLFALYPAWQINDSKEELFEAAKKTIERRLSFGGGHSGWSRAWIINMYARLGMGNEALENLHTLIKDQTLPNLFDNHPPFQIDGNFGAVAGIAEMLVQSINDEINVLPALPEAWKSGRAEGFKLRGGKTLKKLEWKDGEEKTIIIE